MSRKLRAFCQGFIDGLASPSFLLGAAVTAANGPNLGLSLPACRRRRKDGPSPEAIERAVYGHIRALRALGRTHASAFEIARALGLRRSEVARALKALRFANG